MSDRTFSPSQEKAYRTIMQGYNVFVTGNAGTGKSYLMRAVIEDLQAKGRRVIVAASTGLAAMNVGGTTLHRLFMLRPDIYIRKKETIPPVLRETDVLLIDEISMCRIDLFEYIGKVLQKTRRQIQVILFGDFCQLPPVMIQRRAGEKVLDEKQILSEYFGFDVGGGYAFLAPQWKRLNFRMISLTEVIRQEDADLVRALDLVRMGNHRSLGYFRTNCSQTELRGGIYLAGRNAEVDRLNADRMAEIRGPAVVYEAASKGDVTEEDKRVAPEKLELKVGARIMTTVTDPGGDFCNGSLGYVTRLTGQAIFAELDEAPGKEIEIQKRVWDVIRYELAEGEDREHPAFRQTVAGQYTQFPVKPAWAITIHKSQGQTFSRVNLNPSCWDSGQLYVALSRVKSIEGLHLTRSISDRFLKLDPEIAQFYRTAETMEPEDAGIARDMVYASGKKKEKKHRETLQENREPEPESLQMTLW